MAQSWRSTSLGALPSSLSKPSRERLLIYLSSVLSLNFSFNLFSRYSQSNQLSDVFACQIRSQASPSSHLRKQDGGGRVTLKLRDAQGSILRCPSCDYSTTFKHHLNRHLGVMHPSEVLLLLPLCKDQTLSNSIIFLALTAWNLDYVSSSIGCCSWPRDLCSPWIHSLLPFRRNFA